MIWTIINVRIRLDARDGKPIFLHMFSMWSLCSTYWSLYSTYGRKGPGITKDVSNMRKWWILAALLIVAALALIGCSGDTGLPKQPGEYEIQNKSITYDGEEYSFYWVDKDSSIHHAQIDKLKMVQDSRTYLEMAASEPIVHLTPEDPITVKGEDRQGHYSSPWFPFFAGTMVGRMTSPAPTYHYPPSSSFGRDDQLNGSITSDKPNPPDYDKIKPAPNAVSGKGQGTGAGVGVTGKSESVTSGQSGGTGSGSAASEKGGFKSGSSSYSSKSGSSSSSKVGGGSGKSSSSGSKSGSSGSRSGGGSRSSGGGRSGGK